jgi:hypothetical protein
MTPNSSNLAQDLIRIHKVITRAKGICLQNGRDYLESGVPSKRLLAGYSSYVHCLATVLRTHHLSEDLIAFPAFRFVLPDAPYARLASDHHKIEMLLASIQPAIKELTGATPANGLRLIITSLEKIDTLWDPHIHLEEQYFSSDALNLVMNTEEQQRISQVTNRYSQEHSEPPYWVVPFVLYNLEGEDRQVMANNLPKDVVDEKVPVTWKEKWEPMKPFLLD